MVIILAVSLLIALEKVFHSQLLLTVVAHKVLGMPGFTKSSHNLREREDTKLKGKHSPVFDNVTLIRGRKIATQTQLRSLAYIK